ncbi:MAG TPA: nucleotide exchange factor GrpE [Gaiellaceae bacterium]|nr:nucleotide exchange factor GrpE [Gaiellaceae bacterium]
MADKPEAKPARDSGHVEGVRGNREVPPAPDAEADQLEALRQERNELVDTLQRVQAEFDNYRKRTARDQQSLVARAHERLAKELLPVLDDLERALEAAEAHEEAKLEEGVALVARSLADVLRKEGLEEVPTDGRFDPHVHEALLTQPSSEDEGTVIEVLQKGYRLGDRVLRPARVVVAAPKAPVQDA